MEIELEAGDNPLPIICKYNGRTIKVNVIHDRNEIRVSFLRSSADGLQLEAVQDTITIPFYPRVW
jgi:hypothetical protein